ADVNEEAGGQAVEEIRARGGEAVFVHADVSSPEAVAGMVDLALDHFGRLDVAFNNAGIEGVRAPIETVSDGDWERILTINLKGVRLCMKHEIPAVRRGGGGGSIVDCSSVAGLVGFAGSSAYTASKHGVVGITRAAALELAGEGIRVNAVCPGII